MSAPERTVAITGANGYLGGLLQNQFLIDGWRTIKLVRNPTGDEERTFLLGSQLDAGLMNGVDLLIHCAYDMTLRNRTEIWTTNVGGTRNLLELAVSSGVKKALVLSSMSAYEGTSQLYGQAKLEIEQLTADRGWVSIRPGLVYGPRSGGMAGTLRQLANLPVVPLIVPESHQFTIHEDDFVRTVLAIAGSDVSIAGRPIGVANPTPIGISKIIRQFAEEANRTTRFFPVHWKLVKFALESAERMKLSLPIRSDSLMGLMRPAPDVPNIDIIEQLGISLRRFGEPSKLRLA